MTIELIIGIAIGYIPCTFVFLSHSFYPLILEIAQMLITLVFAYLHFSPGSF